MSRLAASSAANLANDLSHALDVAETTNAELLQRLEEAEAVITRVRKVRDGLRHSYEVFWADWGTPPDRYRIGMHDQAKNAVRSLDRIDGL